MWECPDYFNLDGFDLLLFCPQGIEPEGEKFRIFINLVILWGNTT